MLLFNNRKLDLYFIPSFIFLIIASGDTTTIVRPMVTYIFPIILLFQYFISKRYISFKIRTKGNSNLNKSIYIYIIWLLISSVLSTNIINSLYYLLKTIIFFSIIYITSQWIDSYLKYSILLKYIKAAAVFVVTITILQALLNKLGIIYVDSERLAGVYSNVNTGGLVLALLSLFCYYTYIITKKRNNIFLFIYCLIGLLATGSRASLMLVVATFIFMYFRRRIPKHILVIIIIVIITMLIGFTIHIDKIGDFLRIDNGTAGRNFLWIVALQIIYDNFFYGIGIGNLKDIATPYLEAFSDISNWEKEALLEHAVQSSHNMYLEAFVETGVIGFLFYICILVNVIMQIKSQSSLKTYTDRQLSHLLWGITIGIMLRGLFESNGFICKGWLNADILFWLLFILYKRKRYILCQS